MLRLSQPGTARTVRRLVEPGWIERRPGADARSRALHLTRAGRATATRILRARQRALADMIAPQSPAQRAHFAAIASAVLRPAAQDVVRYLRMSTEDDVDAVAGGMVAALPPGAGEDKDTPIGPHEAGY